MICGVCTEPEDAAVLAEAGFEFVELHVQRHLKPEEDEAAEALAELKQVVVQKNFAFWRLARNHPERVEGRFRAGFQAQSRQSHPSTGSG
jgi:hypothetical protein